MENDDVHDCAPVMRDGDEDGHGDVEEALEDAGVDDDEREDATATQMRSPDEPTHSMPDPPHRRMGGGVREEIVIQTDYAVCPLSPVSACAAGLGGEDGGGAREEGRRGEK